MIDVLPNILNIAQEYGLKFQPKTYGKKESLCKCPFCKEDSQPGKEKKYYLSLNTNDQVYKCWYCKQSGGVLDFESKLSGKPFNEIKEKYFGRQRKSLHPAFRLNPYQLDQIGWKEFKRKSFKDFQQKREEVLMDWKEYVQKELTRNFACYICIANLKGQESRQRELLTWFIKKCWKSHVPNMFEIVQNEYLKQEHERSDWAEKGMEIGRIAWSTCIKIVDFDLEDLFVYIIFADYYLRENKKTHSKKECATKN